MPSRSNTSHCPTRTLVHTIYTFMELDYFQCAFFRGTPLPPRNSVSVYTVYTQQVHATFAWGNVLQTSERAGAKQDVSSASAYTPIGVRRVRVPRAGVQRQLLNAHKARGYIGEGWPTRSCSTSSNLIQRTQICHLAIRQARNSASHKADGISSASAETSRLPNQLRTRKHCGDA